MNELNTSSNSPNLEQVFQNAFSGASSQEDDLLNLVDKHSLQLTGTQLKVLMWLYSFKNPLLDNLAEKYLDLKHHNASGEMVIQALNAISLRKFISNFKFNINTNK